MRPLFIDPRDIRNWVLYFFFVLVFPFCWIIGAIVLFKEKYVDYIIYSGGALVVVGFVFVYWYFDRIPSPANEKELKKRLEEMMARGEVLAKETTEPLTPAETQLLTRINYFAVGLLIIVFGAFAWISYYPAKEMAGEPWTIVIPAALTILFAFLIYKYSLLLPKIVKAGTKEVIQGIVTDRKVHSTGRTTRYCLVVGTTELEVSKRDYRTYCVGEILRMDYIKNFGSMVLKITRVNPKASEAV